MTRIFIDGFESGEHDMWDAENNATVVSSVGLDMDGDYCLDLNTTTEYLEKNVTATDEMYFAFLYRHTRASYFIQVFSVFKDGTPILHIGIAGSGVFTVYRGEITGIASGTKVINTNTTYLIEAYFKIDDSVGKAVVKIDNITDIDFTGDTKPGADTQFNRVRLGRGPYTGFDTYAFYDNFIMENAGYPGQTHIQALVPTGAGNATNWTPSAGSNYACVDEIPPSDVDYVSATANDVLDTYATGNMSGSIDSIKCVQIQSRARQEGAPGLDNLKLVVRSGGTDYLSANKALGAAEKSVYNLWEDNPADAAAWEEADVNAMEIGVKSAT